MPNNIYDGVYTTASMVGVERISLPFTAFGDQTTTMYESDWVQLQSTWVALPANSPHPTAALCYLVEETPLTPTGSGGVVRWTRRYCTIPITRNEGGSMAYQFVGLSGGLVGGKYTVLTQRLPQSWTSTVRIQKDYFLVGPGTSYLTFRSVPIILKQRYYLPLVEGYVAPISSTSNLPIGTDVTTLQSSYSLFPSVPTTETYLSWISTQQEIVAEDSTLARWKGFIYERTTKYLLAL